MQTVLDMSLNNGAIKAEQLEGANAFYDNMLAFGIGAPTGVDLAGEVNQQMLPQSRLSALDYAEMSFGQSVSVTPVEMLAADQRGRRRRRLGGAPRRRLGHRPEQRHHHAGGADHPPGDLGGDRGHPRPP